jgi:transcriptional regulator with XRE-family HTH domain
MNTKVSEEKEMTTEKKNQSLGEYVRRRREFLHLNHYEAEHISGLSHTFWRKLEAGHYESPHPKSLLPIAKTLHVPAADLYALAGYDAPEGLPTLRPYLRARYDLPLEAVAQLERYFEFLRAQYGIPEGQSVFPPKSKAKAAAKPKPMPKRRAS